MNQQIAVTDKYDVFKEHGEQPPMSQAHMKRLMRSMKKNGFVPAKAIHVYRDGKFLRIIDGHNRFFAARTLGLPVYYIIGSKFECDLIGDLNSAARVWGTAAFVNMYVQRGNAHYIKLQAYINKGVPIMLASSMLIGESPGSCNAGRLIKDGLFQIKTTKQLDLLLEVTDKISQYNPIIKDNVFMEAVGVCLDLESFDYAVLVDRVAANPRMLEKCSTRDQALDLLEEIYNFRTRDKVNISFQAKEYLRERKALALTKQRKERKNNAE